MTKIAIIFSAVLLPAIATAHPEHASGGDFGVLHVLTDPFHLGLAALAVVIFLAARRSVVRRRPLKYTGE